jgi:hypothetical protein
VDHDATAEGNSDGITFSGASLVVDTVVPEKATVPVLEDAGVVVDDAGATSFFLAFLRRMPLE